MRLAPEGLREWGGATIVAAIAIAPFWIWSPLLWLNCIISVVMGLLWAFVIQFFRDPNRRAPTTIRPGDMLSPADGTISAVQHVDAHEAVDGPAVIVRVFLNVFNVHVNRVPCDGRVIDLVYRKGRFLDARRTESAMVNESNLVRMVRSDGLPLGVRQVAGAVARRIICPLVRGEAQQRGQRMGMIKFGSTTELILPDPDAAEILVSVGDRVFGGRTVLAHVNMKD